MMYCKYMYDCCAFVEETRGQRSQTSCNKNSQEAIRIEDPPRPLATPTNTTHYRAQILAWGDVLARG